MNKKIVIIRTKAGHKYAERIAKKIRSLGGECGITSWKNLKSYLEIHKCFTTRTLLHYRSAGPNINLTAFDLEKKGYRLINSANILDRTSDKYKSYEWANKHGVALPITKKCTPKEIRRSINTLPFHKFVLKPINSNGQGALCFSSFVGDTEIDKKLSQVPGEKIILQQFVEYLKIYRVIVIGGKTVNQAVFYDEPNPNRWKVSVCLNPEIQHEKNPDPKLLSYATYITNIFKSEIAFVDIFLTKDGYVLSEINTACNLTQHEDKSRYSISNEIAKYLISQLNKLNSEKMYIT